MQLQVGRSSLNQRTTLTAQESSSRSRSIHGRLSVAAAFSPDPDASFSPTTTAFFSSSFASFTSDLPSRDSKSTPDREGPKKICHEFAEETKLNQSKEHTCRSARLIVVVVVERENNRRDPARRMPTGPPLPTRTRRSNGLKEPTKKRRGGFRARRGTDEYAPGAGSGAAAGGGGGGGPPLSAGLADGGVLDDERREEDGLLVPPGHRGGRPEPWAEQAGAVLGSRCRRPRATRRGSGAVRRVSRRHPSPSPAWRWGSRWERRGVGRGGVVELEKQRSGVSKLSGGVAGVRCYTVPHLFKKK
jgi:hypothetical protein